MKSSHPQIRVLVRYLSAQKPERWVGFMTCPDGLWHACRHISRRSREMKRENENTFSHTKREEETSISSFI